MATSPTYRSASLPQGSTQGQKHSRLRRVSGFVGNSFLNYWAESLTTILGLLVFAAVSVPFLSYLGLDAIAKPIFFSLHLICAQIPSHSFYIYGHQLGFCARNLSIYTSMFVGSLIFILSKKKMPGIPWYVWIVLLLPMAWDGLTQMFGLRESDWILRVITGTLFGLGNIWFVLPLMQKSITEPATPSEPPMHLDYQRRFEERQAAAQMRQVPASVTTQADNNAL